MAGQGKVTGPAGSPAVRAAAARARAGKTHAAPKAKASAPKAKPAGQGILGNFAGPKPTGKAPGAAAARQASAADFLSKIGANRAPKAAPAKKAPAIKAPAQPQPKASTHSKLNVNAKGQVTGGTRTSTFDNGKGQSVSTTQAIPDTRGAGSKFGSWAGSGTKAVSTKAIGASGKAMPAMLLFSFALVLVAKLRGGKVVDGTKALLGGVFLWFFLTMIALWSPAIATLFAALVAVGVTMEYGPAVFGGLFSGKTTPLKKPLVSGINENVPVGAEGAIGGDIDSHPDSLPTNEGGISGLRGLGPIGSFS